MKPRASGPWAAFVLHQYDWSESSLIVDLFTRERGRIVTVARGAKKPHSQWRALLLPFQRLAVQCTARVDDDAEIVPLRSAEWAAGAHVLRGEACFAGYYMNELVMKLLARQDAHPALFDAYSDALAVLATEVDAARHAALRAFELRLLQGIGLLPELCVDTVTQQALQPAQRYALQPDSGLSQARAQAAGLHGAHWLALHAALSQPAFGPLQAACLGAGAGLREVLGAALHYHLAGQRLRTREVAADVRRLLQTRAVTPPDADTRPSGATP